MKTKHTPGEWIPCKIIGSYDYSVRTEKRPQLIIIPVRITEVNKGIQAKLEAEAEANAKLIAAAPDMFTALMVARAHLEYAIEFGAGAGGESKAIEIIDKAIKKATL